MKHYAYDSNCDLHHLGEFKSKYFAREAALRIFGEHSYTSCVVLSEAEVIASAVTARLSATNAIKPARIRPIKVRPMLTKNGNLATEQFTISDGKGNSFFQSYDSVIAQTDVSGKVILDEKYWNYSRTTGFYRNSFLGEGIDNTRTKINSGEYSLANLNY